MGNKNITIDKYPWRKILPRWFLGLGEIGLSIFLVIKINSNLGLLFSAYWVVAIFVLLPAIRCTKCYYYGKRCNTALGLLAGFVFPKGDPEYFQAGYGLTLILWPLRIIPIGYSILSLRDGLTFDPDGLFGIYIIVMIIHRLFYRASNCSVCHQKNVCPVFNPHVLKPQKSA